MIASDAEGSNPLGQKSVGLDQEGDGLNQCPMNYRFSSHLSVHHNQSVASDQDVNAPALEQSLLHTRPSASC